MSFGGSKSPVNNLPTSKPSGCANQPMRLVATPVRRHSMPKRSRSSPLFVTNKRASARPTLPKPKKQRLYCFILCDPVLPSARLASGLTRNSRSASIKHAIAGYSRRTDVFMKQYHDLLKSILANGTQHRDRTGVGTISHFGFQTRFDLRAGFPIVTTKRVPFRWVAEELFWFLSGDTNEANLRG